MPIQYISDTKEEGAKAGDGPTGESVQGPTTHPPPAPPHVVYIFGVHFLFCNASIEFR